MEKPIVPIDLEIMHGTPCFVGTRVPVSTLFDYLEDDETLESFFEGFSMVSRESVTNLFKESRRAVEEEMPVRAVSA